MTPISCPLATRRPNLSVIACWDMVAHATAQGEKNARPEPYSKRMSAASVASSQAM